MERQPEHGGAADHRAVLGRQRVDLRHRGGFGRVGQVRRCRRIRSPMRSRSRRNCGLPPERFATTSSTCTGSGCLLGRQLRHPHRVLRRERLELDPRHRRSSRARRIPAGRSARDAEKPGPRGELAGEVREQLGRRLVHVVRVLDLDQWRIRHHDLEEPARRPRAVSRGDSFSASISTSGVGAISTSNGDRDQRQPRREVGRARRPPRRAGARSTTASGSSRPKLMSSRSSSRHTAYGVDAV